MKISTIVLVIFIAVFGVFTTIKYISNPEPTENVMVPTVVEEKIKAELITLEDNTTTQKFVETKVRKKERTKAVSPQVKTQSIPKRLKALPSIVETTSIVKTIKPTFIAPKDVPLGSTINSFRPQEMRLLKTGDTPKITKGLKHIKDVNRKFYVAIARSYKKSSTKKEKRTIRPTTLDRSRTRTIKTNPKEIIAKLPYQVYKKVDFRGSRTMTSSNTNKQVFQIRTVSQKNWKKRKLSIASKNKTLVATKTIYRGIQRRTTFRSSAPKQITSQRLLGRRLPNWEKRKSEILDKKTLPTTGKRKAAYLGIQRR